MRSGKSSILIPEILSDFRPAAPIAIRALIAVVEKNLRLEKVLVSGETFACRYNRAAMARVLTRELVVGVSGASGAGLAVRFLRQLASRDEIRRIHLVLTDSALSVAATELGTSVSDPADYLRALELGPRLSKRIELHPDDDLSASISSGSYPTLGMAVVPCSAGTLASIANGISRGLLQRAADVTLKERRPLVLAFRETPYSLVHLENLRAVTLAGAVVMPPSLPFYIGSPSIERLIDAYLSRVARVFGIALPGEFIWTGPRQRR